MSVKKGLTTAAVLMAVGAGAGVPAMALENEFHGMYKNEYYYTNYQDAAPGFLAPAYHAREKSYLEQRGSLIYLGKLNNDYKMVTQFEIDSRWGDNSYNTNSTTRNNGGAVGADQVNLETKSVYIDANLPFPVATNLKLGIQPFVDPYKGIIFGNDGAGAVVTSDFGNVVGKAAFFRFYDNLNTDLTPGTGTLGNQTQDFIMADGKYSLSKNLVLGATYFLLKDTRASSATVIAPHSEVHMFGVNAAANVGPVALDGFFLYQTGSTGHLTSTTGAFAASSNAGVTGVGTTTLDPHKKLSAFAAGAGAKAKLGPGTGRLLSLYISGDPNPNSGGTRKDFATIRSTETQLYAANMMILLRNKDAIDSDRALIHNFNNANQGLIGGFLGYDLDFGRAFWNSNVGFAAAARTNRGDNYMGTELNTEIGYKFLDNFKASIQGAQVFLGKFYDGSGTGGKNPDNPFEVRTVVTYVF